MHLGDRYGGKARVLKGLSSRCINTEDIGLCSGTPVRSPLYNHCIAYSKAILILLFPTMHFLRDLVVLCLSTVIVASPIVTSLGGAVGSAMNSAGCLAVGLVVNTMKIYPSATPFYSSCLAIPTITSTVIRTSTSVIPTTLTTLTSTSTSTETE